MDQNKKQNMLLKSLHVLERDCIKYGEEIEKTIVQLWENRESVVYPGLSQYQKDGYNSLVEIADHYSGAFLCDGVGLGKTFVGLMFIERFVKKERKNVVLMVPASARISVWETTIKKYIPGRAGGKEHQQGECEVRAAL